MYSTHRLPKGYVSLLQIPVCLKMSYRAILEYFMKYIPALLISVCHLFIIPRSCFVRFELLKNYTHLWKCFINVFRVYFLYCFAQIEIQF